MGARPCAAVFIECPKPPFRWLDSKSLLTLFGTRDQHLRKIRDSLGVSVSGRDDRIHIEGQDEAVAHATEVFEQLKKLADRHGAISPDEVSQVLAT